MSFRHFFLPDSSFPDTAVFLSQKGRYKKKDLAQKHGQKKLPVRYFFRVGRKGLSVGQVAQKKSAVIARSVGKEQRKMGEKAASIRIPPAKISDRADSTGLN